MGLEMLTAGDQSFTLVVMMPTEPQETNTRRTGNKGGGEGGPTSDVLSVV